MIFIRVMQLLVESRASEYIMQRRANVHSKRFRKCDLRNDIFFYRLMIMLFEDDREIAATTDDPGKEKPESASTDQRKIGNSSTVKPVIVWVSIPERRRNLDKGRGEFAVKNPFVRRMDDNLQDIGSSENDYVKNIHKGIIIISRIKVLNLSLKRNISKQVKQIFLQNSVNFIVSEERI